VERQLEHAQGVVASGLAARVRTQLVEVPAAGADDEASDAEIRVADARSVQFRVALVIVVVPGEDDIGTGVVERVPQLLGCGGVAVFAARPARLVPVREHALRARGCEVGLEPRDLVASRLRVLFRIERDDVPVAEIEAVVAETGGPCGAAEVPEVPGRARSVVLVVSGRRARSGLVSSPGRSVALRELFRRAVLVGVVAERQDRSLVCVEERGRRLVTRRVAVGDVARGEHDREGGLGRTRRLGRGEQNRAGES
jgi:hypothetical protein